MKKDKTNLKIIIAIIVSVIISSSITAFAAIKISATEIGYNNTTVADQLDSLYQTMFSNNYSTEEKQIGKWIDGKPLYQRVISLESKIRYSFSRSWQKICDLSDATIMESLVNVELINNNGIAGYDLQKLALNSFAVDKQQQILKAWDDGGSNNYIEYNYVIIQYTKTTDQPQTN